MWITLPAAVLTIAVLTVRGRPWHGLVAGTLGFYLAGAVWSLLAAGTGGFTKTVSSPSWWQPALLLGLAAVLTGVPAIRRKLVGRRAWTRAAQEAPVELQRQMDSSAPWQTSLLDSSLNGDTGVRATSSKLLVDEESMACQVSPGSHVIATLDACLDNVPANADPGAPGLSADTWTALLELGEAQADPSDEQSALTISDHANLVLRASSHSAAAGLGLAWRWFSGLRELVDELGTEAQKSALATLRSPSEMASCGEVLAAGWTGREIVPATATVTKEDRGRGEEIGLRVCCHVEDVVGAGAATLVALLVSTVDPGGLLGESATGSLGRTCVLLRPHRGLSLLNGADPTERLGSQPLCGQVEASDVFVDLEHVLGGEAGIGAADAVANHVVGGLHAAGTAALVAGRVQRRAVIEGSRAILRNVMMGTTIEAWHHADLGSLALRSTAISRAAALVLEERPLQPTEARAFASAARGIALDMGSPVEASTPADDAQPPAAFFVPAPPPIECTAGSFTSGWMPTWYRSSLEAAQENSRARFELARTRGLRELLSTVARASLERVLAGRSGASRARNTDVDTLFPRLARAHAVFRTTALRARTLPAAPPGAKINVSRAALESHLSNAEARFTVCVALAAIDRWMGSQPVERDLFEYATLVELAEASTDLAAASGCVDGTLGRFACKAALRSARRARSGPAAELAESVAASIAATPQILRRLGAESYQGHASNGGTAPIRQASRLAAASRVPIASIQRAQSLGQLPDDDFQSVLDLAVTRRIVSAADVAGIRACMAVASEFISRSTPSTSSEKVRRTA